MAELTSDEIRKNIGDALSYPILTEEISSSSAASATAFASEQAPLGRRAESAIRAVLGWRPKSGDSNGFVAALTKSFELIDKQGHTEWKWTPRGFAIQADLGALTGAQASIYQRAKVALDQSLTLLDGLEPLDEGADEEDTAAVRTIVRTHLSELVAELGLEGGPRIQRVDEFFDSLLGEDVAPDEPFDWEDVNGQLGELRERFGFQRGRVNTLEEEQDLTNYIVLLDYIYGLYQSWENWKAHFAGDAAMPFFGTQLIQFSRTLEVITESVHEAYFAMDSVFVGPAERQTTRLKLTQLSPIGVPAFPLRLAQVEQHAFEADIYLADLLEWVERVASVEGPHLVQDAGIDGMKAMYPILDSLRRHVRGALEIARQAASNPSAGFHSDRVRRTLASLVTQLDVAAELAYPFSDVEIGSQPLVERQIRTVVDHKLETFGAGLDAQLTQIKTSLDGLATLPQAVNNLGNRIDPIGQEIAALQVRFDPLTKKVDDLQAASDPLLKRITSLTTRVEKLEKRPKRK